MINNYKGDKKLMNSDSTLNLWIPVLLAAAGAVIGWFASGLFGLVLGVVGIIMATQQKQHNNNTVQLVLTWVFGIIAIIFFLIVIFL